MAGSATPNFRGRRTPAPASARRRTVQLLIGAASRFVDNRGMSASSHDILARRHVYFTGRVQGVGFRCTVQNIAMRYDVGGFVRNTPDGRVELVMEGNSADLDQILGSVKNKMGDFIQDTRVIEDPPTHEFQDFSIRH